MGKHTVGSVGVLAEHIVNILAMHSSSLKYQAFFAWSWLYSMYMLGTFWAVRITLAGQNSARCTMDESNESTFRLPCRLDVTAVLYFDKTFIL